MNPNFEHHHHHQEIPEMFDKELGNPHHHHGEALVEAPSHLLDHRKMDMPAFLDPHHQFTQHLVQLQHQQQQQHQHQHHQQQQQTKKKGDRKRPLKGQQHGSGGALPHDDKKRGRPNIPIGEHSNPSVKYRRISDQVDKLTNEENFLKKMINSEWGKKEYFETHALWHSKIIQNIAKSLKTLPNNSQLRKHIIHLIGDDIPAAVLARVLEVSEKTIYRSRRVDPLRGPVSPPLSEKKGNKELNLLDLPSGDGEEPVSIQSVVVNHQDTDVGEGVHEVMSQNLNNNGGLSNYNFRGIIENTNFVE